MKDQLAYDVEEAAASVSMSVQTIRRAINTTDPKAFPPPLKAKKTPKKKLIGARELREWFDSLPDA